MTDTFPVFRKSTEPGLQARCFIFKNLSQEKRMEKSKFSIGKTAADLWIFVSKDIWRVPQHEVKRPKE